jgi:hypothetical protein
LRRGVAVPAGARQRRNAKSPGPQRTGALQFTCGGDQSTQVQQTDRRLGLGLAARCRRSRTSPGPTLPVLYVSVPGVSLRPGARRERQRHRGRPVARRRRRTARCVVPSV